MVTIKRENIRGKFFVVARDKGKFVAVRKWGKDFKLDQAKRLFKSNMSFNKEVKIEILSEKVKTKEIVTTDIKFLTKGNFQVRASITLDGGKLVSGSSTQRRTGESVEDAKQEAEVNVMRRLAEFFNEGYDEKKGKEVFDKLKGATLTFDFIQYKFTKEGIQARAERGIPTVA